MPKKIDRKKALLISLLANVGLLLAFILTLVLCGGSRKTEDAPALQNVDTQALRDYAADYNVSLEFLQLILPDYLVYTHRGEYVFELQSDKLPHHSYDWSRLSYEQGRTYYRDGDWPDAAIGVDVSYFQKEIDWPSVAADGIDFAFVRLGYRGYSQGALYEDEQARANLDGAAKAGLKVGAYVFSQAVSVEEAEAEAELALEILDGRKLDLPVAFDMEEIYNEAARTDGLSPEQATDFALAFCRRIEQGGYRPMIYGNVAWLSARLELSRLKGYPLWLAQYHYRPLYPYDFQVWQYTSSGQVKGIEGEVDLNICFDPAAL